MKFLILKPIRETLEEYEKLEREINRVLRDQIYSQLLSAIQSKNTKLIKNSAKNGEELLIDAILSGRITYSKGGFKGRFNSNHTRILLSQGAHWDKKFSRFLIPLSKLSSQIKQAIDLALEKFNQAQERVYKRLEELDSSRIVDQLHMEKIFDTTLYKVDRSLKKSVAAISIPPQLTPERRRILAWQYTQNMKLSIKNWTETEIVKIREKIQKSTFEGVRYEELFDSIQKSYDASRSKAKFWARQETNLLITTFKQQRYVEAGVDEYRWKCVIGSPNHPVRPGHQRLNDLSQKKGQLFRFSDPPVDSMPGEPITRNNPGRAYNCRCVAIPIVRFQGNPSFVGGDRKSDKMKKRH